MNIKTYPKNFITIVVHSIVRCITIILLFIHIFGKKFILIKPTR
jgi:hypothetical protein